MSDQDKHQNDSADEPCGDTWVSLGDAAISVLVKAAKAADDFEEAAE